jgi:hypothetical protein
MVAIIGPPKSGRQGTVWHNDLAVVDPRETGWFAAYLAPDLDITQAVCGFPREENQ